MQHPETLQKAREELDAVVGTDRLPTIADRTSLPFIEAVYMEALRWTVPVPLSEFSTCVVHLTTEG
jgi:cytochrome P450